jgi:hypothetical protein
LDCLKYSFYSYIFKSDFEKIQHVTIESKKSQLKYGFATTIGTYLFYRLALQKRKTFYNFFRKNYKYPFLGSIKKGMSLFFLFLVQVNLLNLAYEKTIPTDLFKAGFYKKYHLEFEKVYL